MLNLQKTFRIFNTAPRLPVMSDILYSPKPFPDDDIIVRETIHQNMFAQH